MQEPRQPVQGSVTSLSSLFPPEEAQKAVQRVEDTIASYESSLERVHDFITDNTNLVNLVQRLPDELHHDIMVPFGKGAFFPGRLVHTNEFLVLLGEGYYAETTAKQTIEILKRRGKVLESQAESLKAMMKDLKAEASFFDTTATEAAEGLVEIREDYVEEEKSFTELTSVTENAEPADEDELLARMMAKMDELEKEEREAEKASENDEDDIAEDYARRMTNIVDFDKKKFDSESINNKEEHIRTAALSEKILHHDFRSSETSEKQFRKMVEQYIPQGYLSMSSTVTCKDRVDSAHRESIITLPEDENSFLGTSVSRKVESSVEEGSLKSSNSGFDRSKAFTGSIVEHAPNKPTNQAGNSTQTSSTKPSKPVSRFKMQRR